MKDYDINFLQAIAHMDHNKEARCECEQYEGKVIYCVSNGELLYSSHTDDLDAYYWEGCAVLVEEVLSDWRILR